MRISILTNSQLRSVALFVAWIFGAPLFAADAVLDGRDHPFHDALLDNFVGHWHVARKMGSGRMAENTLHVEWVLNHQFLELHYRDVATPPKYEAMVFIGYDNASERYVAHWIDVFGGHYSSLGYGKLDNDKRAIEFHFDAKDGGLTNKFSFDPQTKIWTSLIRQQENGEWKTFAEDTMTRAEMKK